MGGGYSDLNIYFQIKTTYTYKGNGYTVNVTQKNFPECSDFVVITHQINFTNQGDCLNYNVILYDGYEYNKGKTVFGYYYPKDNNQVIKKVHVYYSVLDINLPLVVSFECDGNTYNCHLGRLKDAEWDRAYNIMEYSFGPVCTKKHLEEAFNNRSRKRKIKVEKGKANSYISLERQELFGEYFSVILIPSGDLAVLGIDNLLSIDLKTMKLKETEAASNDNKNKIDQYYLSSIRDRYYDGIKVYIHEESRSNTKEYTVLLLEFIDTSKKRVQIQRKDKDGYWWTEEPIKYKGNKDLMNKLFEIDRSTDEQVVTVFLDEHRNHKCVKDFKNQKHKTYNTYEYIFKHKKKPIILFEREKKTICNCDDNMTEKVEVHYLKEGESEDKEPFLIVVYIDENKKKVYHFTEKYQFKDWKEFDKPEEIKGKLEKINQFASCIQVLSLLRWYAYQILTGKDPDPDEVKKEEENHRPATKIPEKPPDPLPINWIIGGSVAGGVFVISSAALYGVYWYNTTIKLLT